MLELRAGWKVYLWLAFITYAGLTVYTGTGRSLSFWLEVLFTLVAFVGLYGYAYSRPIGKAIFWRVWLFVLICWDLVSALVHVNLLNLLMLVPFFWFFVPLCVALYKYGFRSAMVWEGGRTARS